MKKPVLPSLLPFSLQKKKNRKKIDNSDTLFRSEKLTIILNPLFLSLSLSELPSQIHKPTNTNQQTQTKS